MFMALDLGKKEGADLGAVRFMALEVLSGLLNRVTVWKGR